MVYFVNYSKNYDDSDNYDDDDDNNFLYFRCML